MIFNSATFDCIVYIIKIEIHTRQHMSLSRPDMLYTHRFTHLSLDRTTQAAATDYMISAIYIHSEPVDTESTKVHLQTVFKRRASNPGEIPSRGADEVVVSPEPPINSTARFIKTPASLGLESVCMHIRTTHGGQIYLESQVNNKIAILKTRAPRDTNRMSVADPSVFTHRLQFIRMAERLVLDPGDIVLLYNTHAGLRDAELVMALVVSLAQDGIWKERLHYWHGIMSNTHNKLKEIWETVNKPSSPDTYLKTQNVERIPIQIPTVDQNQYVAKYLNLPLWRCILPGSSGNAATSDAPGSSGNAATSVPADAPGSSDSAAKRARTSSTFTFGAPASDA